MTFDTKVQLILTLNVLGSIKKKDLLKFMIELNISPEQCDRIFDRIRSEKSVVTYSISLNVAGIRIDSYNSLPI